MGCKGIGFVALVCVLGQIDEVNSLQRNKQQQTYPAFVPQEKCLVSNLTKSTGGNISYCDNSDGVTVPGRHWCIVTIKTESGNTIHLSYRCEGGVWMREFGTSSGLATNWCRYRMKGSNRTMVKLHHDMVIDVETYEDVFGKEYFFNDESVSCEMHSVVDQDANRRRRAATKSEARRWPLEIPYLIVKDEIYEKDEKFDAHVNLTIMKAMEHWSRYTCLHFVERTQKQYDHIIFSLTNRTGCESYVGRMQGPQPIYLNPEKNCTTLPIILHEIGHAIGLYHEHTRPDRDNYVTVHYENIKKEFHYNFNKVNTDQYLDFNKPYDYHSIMHYGKNFLADPSNATSLEPTDKDYLTIIGEAKFLSFHDVQIVNAMYKCEERCAMEQCPQGAFVGKNCECFCQGPPEDPVQRCTRNQKMFCEAPPIDLATYFVYPIEKHLELGNLSGTQYPDGTILIVDNPRCSKQGTGNYTCQDGKWVVNVTCKPDRCVYNRTRYEFEPNITACSDCNGPTMEYVNNGTHVHVKCSVQNGTQGIDSECRESVWVPELPDCDSGLKSHEYYSWDPALPNCDAKVHCKIENFDVCNVEVLFNGVVQFNSDVVPDGSSVQARCKGSNEQNSTTNESKYDLDCNKGHFKGQSPRQCQEVDEDKEQSSIIIIIIILTSSLGCLLIVSLIITCLRMRRKKNSNSGNDDVLPNDNNNDNTDHNDVLPDDVHDDCIVPYTVVPLGNTKREATPMCTSLQPQITDDSAVAEELDNSAKPARAVQPARATAC